MLAERRDDFDVVHDNQCLGTGLLKIAELGLPVVATVHHPITRDRVLDVAAARWWRKPLVRRWYGFAEMQKEVARQIPELLTVSSTSAADIAEDFAVSSDQLHVVPLGVDTDAVQARASSGCATASSRSPAPTCRSRASAICCTRSRGCASSATSNCSWSPSWSPTARPRS